MKGTILQPTYLPWLGYFELIKSSDIYIVLDHVQFNRQSWQHRNKIKSNKGIHMLTVPVMRKDKWNKIKDVRISYNNNPDILKHHWNIIKDFYHKSTYLQNYEKSFENIFNKKYTYIRDLNVAIIDNICDILDIHKKKVYSSDLKLNDENMSTEDKLINLCKKMNITHMYEPAGGKLFLNPKPFSDNGIYLEFQNIVHPVYNQLYGEFISYISIIDMLFNEGNNSINILNNIQKKSSP